MKEKKKRRHEGKKARTTSGGTPWEKAGWRERGRERLEERERGIVRATRASIASGNERSEGPVRNAEGARGGARGGTEGGIRRVKEVRSEEGERASEMRA